MSTFLGVDGGGTRTTLCLVTDEGELLATLEAPSCYYLGQAAEEGRELVLRVLRDAIPALLRAAGTEAAALDYAFFGLPAYGEVSADVAWLDAAPQAVLGHTRYRCDNDMVCGWAGSLALADGINVISGTGSMTYGRRREQRARVGGWGELFGDEGSGYWIGIRGLRAFGQMSDGRLSPGPLLDLLRERLHLAGDLDAVDLVLERWRGGRRQIAALSPVVVEAAQRGDEVAATILTDAATELVRLVTTTRHRLGFPPGEAVPVSYSGGVFQAAEVLRPFREALTTGADAVDLRPPRFPPVLGAALYAARLAGAALPPTALERLEHGPGLQAEGPRPDSGR